MCLCKSVIFNYFILRCLYHTCQVLKKTSDPVSEPSSRRQSTAEKQSPSLPQSPDGTAKPSSDSNRGFHEITKTATLVFNALQPSYPWMHLTDLLRQTCILKKTTNLTMAGERKQKEECVVLVEDVGEPQTSVCEVCTLLQHLLTALPLDTQQQTQASRLPEVLSTVTSLLTDHLMVLDAQELLAGLSLCQAIVHKLIPSVTLPPTTSLSRPDSRTSIATFASLQLQALSQISPVVRPMSVPEAMARESPPTDCGIVQIGIEASEDDSTQHEKSSSSSVVDGSSNVSEMLEVEAETSFICSPNSITDNSQTKLVETKSDTGNNQELIQSEHYVEKTDDIFECSEEQNLNDRFESGSDIDLEPSTAEKTDTEVITEASLPRELLDHHEGSEDEFESAPQSPNHCKFSPIHSYVKDFERFFLEFIQKRLLSSDSSLTDFQQCLFKGEVLGADSLSELKCLLNECLLSCETSIKPKAHQKTGKKSNPSSPGTTHSPTHSPHKKKISAIDLHTTVHFNPECSEQLEVFQVSCNLLVDLSSLPTTLDVIPACPSINIPQWLFSLLACVICGQQVSPQFSLASVSTLLELVMLAQSELSVWRRTAALEAGGGDGGVVHVNITPLLLPAHTHILLHHTSVYQVSVCVLLVFFLEDPVVIYGCE